MVAESRCGCGKIMQELSWLSSCQRIFSSRTYGTSLPTEWTVARLYSRQLTQVHLCLKQARDQLELLDFLNDLMIMNCQRLDWTLSLLERLTAVPCLSCYGTEPNFFIQYLSLCSRFIVDFSFCSKKTKKEGCSVLKPDV